jgi:hypothetical protein
MQYTYVPGDPDYENFLWRDREVKDVTVVYDPSLLTCSHDYSCPVCREKYAVLSRGVMQPCWDCQGRGYKIVQRNLDKKWWEFWEDTWLLKWNM